MKARPCVDCETPVAQPDRGWRQRCDPCRITRKKEYKPTRNTVRLPAPQMPPADPNRPTLASLFSFVETEQIVTVRQAAETIGRHQKQLSQVVSDGGIESFPIGKHVFIRLDDAIRWSQHVMSYRRRNGRRSYATQEFTRTRDILLRCDLSSLYPRTQDMLKRYYGLDHEFQTMVAIAQLYGLSRERVRQLVSAGVARLIHDALDKAEVASIATEE